MTFENVIHPGWDYKIINKRIFRYGTPEPIRKWRKLYRWSEGLPIIIMNFNTYCPYKNKKEGI